MKKALAITLLVLAGGGILAWLWTSPDEANDAGGALVFDRLWVDAFPENPRDEREVFIAITRDPIGVFDRASTWAGSWELFRHEPHGDGAIDLLYPQSGKKERAKYRAWRCSENGFDFCLELKGASRGVARYHSLEGWELDGVETADAARARAAEILGVRVAP